MKQTFKVCALSVDLYKECNMPAKFKIQSLHVCVLHHLSLLLNRGYKNVVEELASRAGKDVSVCKKE